MSKKGTPVVGQGCKVTKGSNKGKTGTYTNDPGFGFWCEGDWGGTACKGGYCANKAKAAQVQIFEFPDIG